MQQTLFMLDYLSDADLAWMARTGLRKAVPDGKVLVNQGVHTESLFIILEGCAAVVVEGLGVIARLGAGEVMGEMSFVDSTPPSATVTDIGTSFGVMVDKAGETSVTVAWLDELEADRHKPSVILLDGRNEVVRSSGHA